MLRVSEIYASIQGEGPKVGVPTIFLRFGGCNLRCSGWPCDTQHAIDPKFRQEWKSAPETVIAATVIDLQRTTGCKNVCLTGGEPFLQNKARLNNLTSLLMKKGFEIECFSNGQLEYPEWAGNAISFVMDWKLPGSEEYHAKSPIQTRNLELLDNSAFASRHAVKFTIADEADFDVAKDIWNDKVSFTSLQVYAGVVWGKLDNSKLIEWMLAERLPWKFTAQIHNMIWDRNKRGI